MTNKAILKIWITPFVLFLLFVVLAILVCTIPQITLFDIKLIQFFQTHFSFISVDVADKLSLIHHNWCGVVVFATVLFLIYKKNVGLALMYFICDSQSHNITVFVKNIIQRHRPPVELQPLYHPADFSFPSGHSINIMLFFGLIIYVIFRYVDNKYLKYSLSLLLSILIFLVGLSRNLLGVHYPTDVLAGFIFGLFIISIVVIVDKSQKE